MKYIINRFKERSTWLGLISLVTALGVTVQPDWVESITALGVAVAGFVGIITKDTTSTEAKNNDAE